MPWTETTKLWEAEAFTARTRVMGTMLAKYGNVILYAGEANESQPTEHVQVVDRRWQQRHFPDVTPQTVFGSYDVSEKHWYEWNVLAAMAIRARAQAGDILGLTMGASQKPCADLLSDLGLLNVEVGIGYGGVWAPFRVYESWSWRVFHAGRAYGMATAQGADGAESEGDQRNFDTVIPRGYEVEDFSAGDGKGGYFLFFGRVVDRKGPAIAAQACQRLGAKLVVAGQGVTNVERGRLTAGDGTVLEGDVEYAGVVGPEERARLMGGAIAVFAPTKYSEPFGGSHAESMLVGTPVITSDWGCFQEYVQNGANGYKCSSMADYVLAARDAGSLDRLAIRDRAIARYSTEVVGPQYDKYFRKLATLRRSGWYEMPLEKVA